MYDPYTILGISRDATDDEIKKAYRALSRQYHPDANIDNPNKQYAEEKFKEVQQAYQQIMDEKENSTGSYGGFGGGYGFGGFTKSKTATDENSVHLQAAANYINSGHYQEALNVLAAIKLRDAQWYYLSAIANAGIGNNVSALDYAKQAAGMEPSNMTYQQLLQRLSMGGSWYKNQRQPYATSVGGNGFCLKLCLINMFCNLCCGGGGVCCGGRPYGYM